MRRRIPGTPPLLYYRLDALPVPTCSALDGEVAIVTGGLGRLGSQYVATLARAGAAVARDRCRDDRRRKSGAWLDGGLPVSIASRRRYSIGPASIAAIDEVVARFGDADDPRQQRRPRIVPAGRRRSRTGPFEHYPESAWDAMIDSHLKSALVASQSFIARVPARIGDQPRTGSIINVSSTYGVVSPDQSVYDVSAPRRRRVLQAGRLQRREIGRAELHALAGRVLRADRRPRQHARARRCAEAGHAPEFVAEYEKRTPLGRMAADDDYNGAVLFLRLARVGVHDRRDAGRRRRLDGKMTFASSSRRSGVQG